MTIENTNKKTGGLVDRKTILSTLWIFAVLNYIYADVFSAFFYPEAHTATEGMAEGAVLGFAVLMETAIAMVLLSRILTYRVNRWANIIVAVLHTLAVAWSLIGGMPLYYLFFAAIEIACTLFIIWYAWTWPKADA
jgi:hypothetical protein